MSPKGTIFIAAVLTGIAIGLAGFAGFLTLRPSHSPQPPRLSAEIGSIRLHLDPALARFDEQRRGGRLDRLDLALLLPDFRPAGRLAELNSTNQSLAEKMVFLTITTPDDRLDPAERFVKLYARFLGPDQSAGPAGLIRRQFEPLTPFADEDLYLTAPEGRQFSARCRHRPAPLPDSCLHEFWLDGLAIQLRFSPSALPDWQALKARSEALITNSTH